MVDEPFELKTSWREAIELITIGIFLIILIIGGLVWIIYPFFTIKSFSDGVSVSLLLIGICVVGFPFLIYLIGMFSFMLISLGISYIIRLERYGGLIYRLDKEGITYFENNKCNVKKWSEILDVGCFKQEDKKVKVLYKYQIKFVDGTIHEFDLRGKYPTKKFKEIIEDYWLQYNN